MLSDAIRQPSVQTQKRSKRSVKDAAGMSVGNTLTEAWEGLVLNKLRSFLTTLGIIIGVAAVIIMLAVSAGAEAAIADQINTLGANLVMVTPFRAFGGVGGPAGGPGGFGGGGGGANFRPTESLTYEDALALETAGLDNIEGVTVEQTTNQAVTGGPSNTSETGVSIVGVTPD